MPRLSQAPPRPHAGQTCPQSMSHYLPGEARATAQQPPMQDVVVQLFSFGWAPDWGVVLATLAGGAVLTLGIGLAGSIPLMSVRPARALRQL